jgi:peroxiredoxin (alkyl hydroperoxide reductase subunit C)
LGDEVFDGMALSEVLTWSVDFECGFQREDQRMSARVSPRCCVTLLCSAFVVVLMIAAPSWAQVLGSCGTPGENSPASTEEAAKLQSRGVLLPGQHALNFELPAVVGDEIKMVKLSDYNGKWRVVCFYPADFTFV